MGSTPGTVRAVILESIDFIDKNSRVDKENWLQLYKMLIESPLISIHPLLSMYHIICSNLWAHELKASILECINQQSAQEEHVTFPGPWSAPQVNVQGLHLHLRPQNQKLLCDHRPH